LLNGTIMSLVNSLCAEISIYQGVGEATGTVVEKKSLRGRRGLCKSMRDLSSKVRVLGDGYYYLPVDLWPGEQEPVVLHQQDWTPMGSIPRRRRKKKTKSSD
jgi:hypothetical protein